MENKKNLTNDINKQEQKKFERCKDCAFYVEHYKKERNYKYTLTEYGHCEINRFLKSDCDTFYKKSKYEKHLTLKDRLSIINESLLKIQEELAYLQNYVEQNEDPTQIIFN